MQAARLERDRHRSGNSLLQISLPELSLGQSRGRYRSRTPHAGPQKREAPMCMALSHLVVAERQVAGQSKILRLCLVAKGVEPQRPLIVGLRSG